MKRKIIYLLIGLLLVGVVTAGVSLFNSYEDALADIHNRKSGQFDFDRDITKFRYFGDKECEVDFETEIPTCEIFFEYTYDKMIYRDQITVDYGSTLEEDNKLIRKHLELMYAPKGDNAKFTERR